jgi:hypothetical protein
MGAGVLHAEAAATRFTLQRYPPPDDLALFVDFSWVIRWDLAGGRAERCPGQPIPPANVLIWLVGGDARLMIRPSGTEPELKIYAEVVQTVRSRGELPAARAADDARVDQLLTAAAATLAP